MQITVTPPLTTSLKPNRTLISADQGVSFANVTSNGTGSNVYTYTVSPNSGFTQNGNNFTFTSPGNYTVTLNVTDLSGETASANAIITVTPELTIKVSPNRTFISADQNITFTNSTSGGTGDNVYNFSVSPNSGFSVKGNVINFNTAGNYSVTVYVTDLSGEKANATFNVTVTPALTINLTANRTLISLEQSVTFTNTTTGGTGDNKFNYTVNGVPQGASFSFGSVGLQNVTIYVTDLSGESAHASVIINVTPALNVSLKANRTFISADQCVSFTTNTTGGTGSNQYSYSVVPKTEGLYYNVDTNQVCFNIAGNYTVSVNVTDLSGEKANASVNVTVTPPLVIRVSPNRTLVSADQNVTFENFTTGGTGNNTFTYKVVPNNGFTQNGNTIDFNTAGNYSVTVYVTDLSGEKANATFNVTVTPALTINLTANRTFISQGQLVSFQNTTSGGTGDNQYNYTLVCDSWIQHGNVINFTDQGICTVNLHVTDLSGETANALVAINVTPPLTLNLTANKTFISADQNVSFTNFTTGGTGNTTFTYNVQCESNSETPYVINGNVITFTAPAICRVQLNVTDFSGETANASVFITVTPVLNTTIFVNRTLISAEQSVSVSNLTTGGTGNNTYTYTVSPDSGFVQNGNVFTFNEPGNYVVSVNVTDLSGEVATADSATIVVTPLLTTLLIASNTTPSIGQWVNLTNITAGGTGSNVYSYAVSPNNGFTFNGNKVAFFALANYSVTLFVTDLSGEHANSTVYINLTNSSTGGHNPPPPHIRLIVNRSYISADQGVKFTNVTTPSTNDIFSYTVAPNNGFVEHGNVFNFTSAGNYIVTEHVTHFGANSLIQTANSVGVAIIVTPALVEHLNATFKYISQGQTVTVFNVTTGGTGSNVFSKYTVVALNASPANSFKIKGNKFTFTLPGHFKVTQHVFDLTGEKSNSSIIFSVTKPLSVTTAANRTSVKVGQKVSFTENFFGGTPGSGVPKVLYSGTLVIIPGSGYTINGKVVTFTAPGVYDVHVHATDYSGETANSNVVTITVH